MASEAGKSTTISFLFINALLYLIVIIIAGCSVVHAMEKTDQTASPLSFPARIFPIYFPLGNMATGFFVIFSLIAGVVGFVTSVMGMYNVMQWDAPHLHAAAASSLATWTLTLLALGLAWKEINIGWADTNLMISYIKTSLHNKTFYHFTVQRALQMMVILLSGTQFLATTVIHVRVEDIVARDRAYQGRF